MRRMGDAVASKTDFQRDSIFEVSLEARGTRQQEYLPANLQWENDFVCHRGDRRTHTSTATENVTIQLVVAKVE